MTPYDGYFYPPRFAAEDLRPREVKSVAQSHTAQMCQCQDSNPALEVRLLHPPYTPRLVSIHLQMILYSERFGRPSRNTPWCSTPGQEGRPPCGDNDHQELLPEGLPPSFCPVLIVGIQTRAGSWVLRTSLQMGPTFLPREGSPHPLKGRRAS